MPAQDLVEKACESLRRGDVVAIPTETVYGLAASINSREGLKKVFETKQRPFFDPLIVHVASFAQAKAVTSEWPPLADFIARYFWPGPLTLVLKKSELIHPLITSGLETVAVRMPNHPMAIAVIEKLGAPVAAPSANRFGRTSPSKAEHVRAEFPDKGLLILDGGACEVGLESTVISIHENEIKILRPGGVTEADLQAALKKWAHPVQISRAVGSENSPGHLQHHYMPEIPLVILSETATLSELQKAKPAKKPVELVLNEEPQLAARELYDQLRTLSKGADLLYVRRSKHRTGGFWDAIWDRLTRAATLDLSSEPG